MKNKLIELNQEEHQKYVDAVTTRMRSIEEEGDENLQFEYDILKLALYALNMGKLIASN